jgi:hypothetical protein
MAMTCGVDPTAGAKVDDQLGALERRVGNNVATPRPSLDNSFGQAVKLACVVASPKGPLTATPGVTGIGRLPRIAAADHILDVGFPGLHVAPMQQQNCLATQCGM